MISAMRQNGFGLLEAIVTMAIAGVALAAVVALLIQQQRFYLVTGDASATEARLQPIKTALAPEFWPVNPADGDILYIADDSLVTRVYRGVYAVCNRALPSDLLLTLRRLSANGSPTLVDSALVYNEGPSADPDDDGWTPVSILSIGTGTCADGSSGSTIMVPNVNGLAGKTPIGASVRLFEHGSYWLAERADGWTLTTDAHGGVPRVIGEPLAPVDPSEPKPLKFSYLDVDGNPATSVAAIVSIEIEGTAIGDVPIRPSGEPYRAERTLLLRLRNTE